MMIQIIAVISCGIFFGAALYISLVQHPALLIAGAAASSQFFPPMYTRAKSMQVACAILGSLSALLVWWQSASTLWLIGAILLLSVIPITLLILKPINDVLITAQSTPQQTEVLLRQWGKRHWLRTAVSGAAFVIYVIALSG